jgi:endoglucanase
VPELLDLGVVMSNRGYFPAHISHHRAPWAFANIDAMPTPTWPGYSGETYYNRESLEAHYAPWIDLVKQGIGVHCGELGCYNQTPHDVFLAWFSDTLDILKDSGIGFALWEFKGDFGILNSGRNDVKYEDWHGYQLDRKLLELLINK